MRAILREECDKTLAAALEFLVLNARYGEKYGNLFDVTEAEAIEITRDLGRMGSSVHESGIAYVYRWMAGVDPYSSETEMGVSYFNMIIEDLEDGEC